jgi:tRNA(adenine34) deaminase
MIEKNSHKKELKEFEKKYPSALTLDDTYFMTLAYNLSIDAYRADEVPVGAIIVKDSAIVSQAFNQVETLKDATAHAEMLCITQAAQKLSDWRLSDCTLYVTKEPCPMCAGALMLARISKVVYAIADPKTGGNGGALNIHQLPESFHRYKSTQINDELSQNECTEILKEFFRAKRRE